MNRIVELDADNLLNRVSEQIPWRLRPNVVVIGSIAVAWTFRKISGTNSVATKDIDLLLRPAVDAVITARTIGRELLDDGWQPHFPDGRQRGTADTPDDQLPALRLRPPGSEEHWFIELLAEPSSDQVARKHWSRLPIGPDVYGLPSFRFMLVAIHDAEETPYGLRVARPARMALAHLLEHADPDRTGISSLPGGPPRFVKDVGRAICLWWLARELSSVAGDEWASEWRETLGAIFPDRKAEMKVLAHQGLANVAGYLREAHALALNSVLAPHGTTLDAFQRAYASLLDWIDAFQP